MPRSKKGTEAALQKKGFELRSGDHNYFIYRTLAGMKSRVFAKTSHGHSCRDISDDLLSQMARQCKLTRQNFLHLIDCPLDQKQYEHLLRSQGWL